MSDYYASLLGITPTSSGTLLANNGLTIDPSSTAAQTTSTTSTVATTSWLSSLSQWFMNTPGLGTPLTVPGDNSPTSKALAAPLNAANAAAQSAGTNPTPWLITAGVVLLAVLMIVLGTWSIVKD